MLTYASETSTLTKRDRKKLNIFERKVYRRILGLAHENKKENWKILTLSLLMSYIYGAPSKAINLTSCIYGRDFYWGFYFLNRAFR
jgi:uncharacterized MAPEG superfamily protein